MQEISLKTILDGALPIIDSDLSNRNEPLSTRPLRAAILFVKYFIVEIKGEDKDNFHDHPWFSAILNYINKWYFKRYGDAYEKNDSNIKGLIFIYNHPFEINFPFSLTIDEGDKETISVIMLSKFRSEENWKKYIISGPDLDTLDSPLLRLIEQDVIETVEKSRHFFHNFAGIDSESSELKVMAASIQDHINSAVFNIVSTSHLKYNLALWDLHLALEKSLKMLLMQTTGKFPKTHDLVTLFSLTKFSFYKELHDSIHSFPNHKKVIELRYSESDFQNPHEIRDIYINTLNILYNISNLIKKKLTVHGATFYIKRPTYPGITLGD
jgi:HEPN domain-containing protein